MAMHRYRIFTRNQANEVLPLVREITERTRARLQKLQNAGEEGRAASEDVERETREALDDWARGILEIGAQPKGVFTVDFRSPDPNVLWCWAPSEPEITHRHFTWESFKDRVAIAPSDAWPSLN